MKTCPKCGSFIYFNSYQRTSTCTDCFWEDNNISQKVNTMIEELCSNSSRAKQEVDTLTKPVDIEVKVKAKNNLFNSLN